VGDATTEVETGRWLFAQTCNFVAGADSVSALPPITRPEIAFAGRSNVGKSSLVNALTGRKTLARTSHTPGRTQQLNFFDLGGRVQLVDMPGYGYAAVGRSRVSAWEGLIRDYLRGRTSLLRVYLLVDGRHGLKPIDHETMDAFDKAAISYAVVLTKADDVKASVLEKNVVDTLAGLARHPAAYPDVVVTSSETGVGIVELRTAVVQLLRERAPERLPAFA
jgi:GTP-binding protein